MSRYVFVLGAGASRDAGGPLMRDFLDMAEDLQRSGQPDVDFTPVFRGIAALSGAHSKATLDLNNIESVFAAFEMAALFGRSFGNLSAEEVHNLGSAIRRLIVRTLELSIRFPMNANGQVLPPNGYWLLVKLLVLLKERERTPGAVITFNYDIGLDYAFHFATVLADYCLSDPRPDAIRLLKLHGSINWARCVGECRNIVPISMATRLRHAFWYPGSEYVHIEMAKHIAETKCCETLVSPEPEIVPPTWNKAQYHNELAAVWKRAAQELSDAEHIFVLGYSLPETDQFFRLLYALGTVSETRLRRFWIFNPDPTDSVERRFRSLLGQAALERFDIIRSPFDVSVVEIGKRLGIGTVSA